MSQVLDPPTTHALSGVLGAVDAAWDEAGEVELWQLSDAELLEATAELHRQQCRADALKLRLVREVDARGAAVAAGAFSTAGWLCHGLRMHPGAAKAAVSAAAALHADPAGPLVPVDGETGVGGLAAARAALADGAISFGHVSVITRSMNALPGERHRHEAGGEV